ncbi:hypothetical protein [Francisella marina]|uniref:DUF2528 family protein n=1 Tax=Francisella marina TaxID=2249302 RepID=A0ABX5ZGV5_9GAMM|nr:hypothetical protein [Francisella marina]QEO57592.1 hypothetical protein F0R74_06890 [Francisella marina]
MNITEEFKIAVDNDCDFNFADVVAEIVEELVGDSHKYHGEWVDSNAWGYEIVELYDMKLKCEWEAKQNDNGFYIDVVNVTMFRNMQAVA